MTTADVRAVDLMNCPEKGAFIERPLRITFTRTLARNSLSWLEPQGDSTPLSLRMNAQQALLERERFKPSPLQRLRFPQNAVLYRFPEF